MIKDNLQQAINAWQPHCAENYLQEALIKINLLKSQNLIWYFIGPIQSNKTLKIAKRLNDQCSKNLPKLKVLLQINIDNEPTKLGVLVEHIDGLVTHFEILKNLTLRGFMCIPNSSNSAQSFTIMTNIITT